YTDNTGNQNDNIDLSQRRAEAVVSYLISAGISEDRLIATGYGTANPIASNDTFEGRAKNRRIEVKILQQ
ncbi:MAG: OmpA family protein, partial [Candidatus Stygibacter frigidus]|nr:OmpA family protein [Candidatus Stygibacter frigidus]